MVRRYPARQPHTGRQNLPHGVQNLEYLPPDNPLPRELTGHSVDDVPRLLLPALLLYCLVYGLHANTTLPELPLLCCDRAQLS